MRVQRVLLVAAALAVLLLPSLRSAPDQHSRERQDARNRIWGNIASLLEPAQSRAMGGSRSLERVQGMLKPGQVDDAISRLESLKRSYKSRHAALLEIGRAMLVIGKEKPQAKLKGHLTMAHALDALKRPQEALESAKAAEKIAPGNGEVVSLIKLLRRKTGRPGPKKRKRGGSSRPHFSLTPDQVDRIDNALLLLGRTDSGREIIMAVAPDSNGVVDLEELQRARVDVRAARRGVLKSSPGKVEEAQGGERIKFTHIIKLDEKTIADHRAALAAQFGHNLNDVSFLRRWGRRASRALMEQLGKVKAVWVSLELKKQGEAFSPATPLTKALSFWTMIWEDDLKNKRWTRNDAAVYGDDEAAQFTAARRREIKTGVRGVEAFWWLVSGEAKLSDARNIGSKQHEYKTAVRDPVVKKLTKDDTDYRKNNGHPPLPKD